MAQNNQIMYWMARMAHKSQIMHWMAQNSQIMYWMAQNNQIMYWMARMAHNSQIMYWMAQSSEIMYWMAQNSQIMYWMARMAHNSQQNTLPPSSPNHILDLDQDLTAKRSEPIKSCIYIYIDTPARFARISLLSLYIWPRARTPFFGYFS